MSSTDDILDAIDSALRDTSVSPDAMRSAPDAPADVADPATGGVTTVRFVPDMPDLHAPTVAELRDSAINLTAGVGDVTFYRDDGYRRAWDSPSRTVLISFDFGDRFTAPVTAVLVRLAEVPVVSREQLARRADMKTAYRRRRNRR